MLKFKFRTFSLNIEVYSILYMLYTLLVFNGVFFEKIYNLSQSTLFTTGTFLVVWALLTLCGWILFWKRTVKPLSVLFLLVNSGVFYFVKNYNIAIDEEMLRNVLQTNIHETTELLNFKLFFYILLWGVLPSVLIYYTEFTTKKFNFRLKFFAAGLVLIAAVIIPNSKNTIQFIRNHKPVKYTLIPVNYIGAVSSMTKHNLRASHKFIPVGTDSHFTQYWQNEKPALIVFIVGETARAANFSLNGYNRDTNAPLMPYLNEIINFTDMTSCGTSTAVSVPCMFSKENRTEFDTGSLDYTGNILDIFNQNGWRVIWLENNSDCKGVCTRIKTIQPCSGAPGTCFDDILLKAMKTELAAPLQNTILVMHQAGSHGPTYYKRYPEVFERFAPVCNTEKLNQCSSDEIKNTYDNTIFYTSQNIADIISALKADYTAYNSFLFYVSDHGESLGEYNIYLHSAPYVIAPKEQTHIPFFIWASDSSFEAFKLDKQCLKNNAAQAFSHDNIFHTLLGIGGISAAEYKQHLDLMLNCRY